MGLRLFPSKPVVTRDDMHSPDPQRQIEDHSSPEYQERAHTSAGYTKAGSTDKSTDNTLVIGQDDDGLYRAQNGVKWIKSK